MVVSFLSIKFKRIASFIVFILFALICFSKDTSYKGNQDIREISFDELKSVLLEKDYLLLDARPEVFYNMGYIANALNLPIINFEEIYAKKFKEFNFSKFSIIVVYCSDVTCDDSIKLAKVLSSKDVRGLVFF